MILKYLKTKEWLLVAICILLISVQVYFDLEIPAYMSSITTIISTGGTTDQVVDDGVGMVLCAFGSLIAAITTGYIAAYVAASLSVRLRELQFEKVLSYSTKEMNDFSTASLITRSTNDVNQIQVIVAMGLQIVIKAPILAVWAMVKIADNSWQWSAATALAIIAVMTMISIFMIFIVPRFRKVQWLTDNLNRVTGENLSGVRVIRAYNAEEYQEKKFDEANEELTSNNLFTSRSMALMMPSMSLIMSLLSLSIYWIGAILINALNGDQSAQFVTFTDMIVFSSYAMQIVMAFIMTIYIIMFLPRALVASKRVQEVIEKDPSIKDGPVSNNTEMKGQISFENVSFRYSDTADYVLKDINLDIKKGETVAFIGSTGSGKSTLINLILRSYDITDGKILIDGVDIKEYKLETLHEKMGYVPQKAVIFTGTVEFNVKYGDSSENCTDEDMKRSIAISQGREFIENMDGTYKADLSRDGTNLSGGQKQRISIARAVCKKPEFYLFDDSFSALDYKTDRILRENLKKETAGVTCIIVAQRIGTIIDADQIVVLDEGHIVGIGKHKELLKGCPIYRDIASSQLSPEELGL
jgi:ATP-binding cassette, subfamily B, multidrug efflux pump